MGRKTWCVHYAGLMRAECHAGVTYADVRHAGKGLERYPCFKDQPHAGDCPSCRFMTPQEEATEDAESTRVVREFLTDLAEMRCPHCKTPLTKRVQVGRSVYGEPCHHRLYQGKV